MRSYKKPVQNGTAKIIKIDRDALEEIVVEYIMGEQASIFHTRESRREVFELSFSFLDNGDLVCAEYDRNKGILCIEKEDLEKLEYTTESLFSSSASFRKVTIKDGKIAAVK